MCRCLICEMWVMSWIRFVSYQRANVLGTGCLWHSVQKRGHLTFIITPIVVGLNYLPDCPSHSRTKAEFNSNIRLLSFPFLASRKCLRSRPRCWLSTGQRTRWSTSPTAWHCSSAAPRRWSLCGWRERDTMTLNCTASIWSACAASSARRWQRTTREHAPRWSTASRGQLLVSPCETPCNLSGCCARSVDLLFVQDHSCLVCPFCCSGCALMDWTHLSFDEGRMFYLVLLYSTFYSGNL